MPCHKDRRFKRFNQSPYSTSLRICQHCGVDENNTSQMRPGPAGRFTLCNTCGVTWAKKGILRDLSKRQRTHSVDQSGLGISEDPCKFIVAEGSNNHALNPIEEELPESSEHQTNTLPLGIDHSSENDDGQSISEDPSKATTTEGSNYHALNPIEKELPESSEHPTNTLPLGIHHSSENDDVQPMKRYSFSEFVATAESFLAFLDEDLPSFS